MANYVALKQFGGGKKLRSKYGRGYARFVQKGTVIDGKDMTESHRSELEGLKLIEPRDPKKDYETQADTEKRVRHNARNQNKPKEQIKPKGKEEKSDKDDKKDKKKG